MKPRSRTHSGRRPGLLAPARVAPDPARDVIADTGLVVALYGRNDRCHVSARRWLGGFEACLHTVEAVLTESAHLLPTHVSSALAEAAALGLLHVHPLDLAAYRRIAILARHYSDLSPDWTDLALVWLAESIGLHRIATLDAKDFGVYRIRGRRAFEIVWP